MIGIQEIASYVPDTYVDNLVRAKKLNSDEDFVRNKLGILKLPNIGDKETSDLAVLAVTKLLNKSSIDPKIIDCLVVCTQNPDGDGIPHCSALVQSKVDMRSNSACFDISLGCSGYVYGLKIIEGFMEVSGMKNGILVTADPYSKIIDPDDRDTALLFGDASTATLLSSKYKWKIGESLFNTDGYGADNLKSIDGVLHMNGRQVFNFAMIEVPKQIATLLENELIKVDDIDSYVFHQGSRYIVEMLRKKLKLPPQKVPIELEEYGNTVSSSIPLILEKIINNNKMNIVLLSGFGVGLSWSSLILKRNN